MYRTFGLICLAVAVATCRVVHPLRPSAPGYMAADVAYLASTALEGRAAGSEGGDSAAVFIAQRYAQLGVPGAFASACASLSPCDAAFFQRFRARGVSAENVVATIPGADPTLRGRYVVVGAHYDHLGRSVQGALDPELGGMLRLGADDNASGTAAVLEVARRLAINRAPASVLLAHFDAEEFGLVGSREFVEHLPVPLDSIVLMINLDMVGRLAHNGGQLLVEVTSAEADLRGAADSLATALGISLSPTQRTAGRSDHSTFAERGVPSIALSTGLHSDYHRVTDTPDKIDFDGMLRVVALTVGLVRAAASQPN